MRENALSLVGVRELRQNLSVLRCFAGMSRARLWLPVGSGSKRRAGRRAGPHTTLNAFGRVVESIAVIECDALIADRASGISPAAVRTLDAIHVATALALGRTLDAFVTYDERLAEAAREAGLPVVMPAA
jgi:predicted nucleic acid-binding protein